MSASDLNASQPNAKSNGQLISLPIFWQVLGLTLAVLVLAISIITLIVLKAPEPPPSGYSVREVVSAFKTGEVKLQNGRVMRATTESDAPAFVAANPNHTAQQWRLETLLAARLAGELHVPVDTIWVKFEPHGPFRDWNHFDHTPGGGPFAGQGPNGPQGGPQGGFQNGFPGGPGGGQPYGNGGGSNNGPNNNQNNGPPPGGNFGPGPSPGGMPNGGPHFGDGQHMQEHEPGGLRFGGGIENRNDIFFPSFQAAWKLADGTYRVIHPPHSLIQPWQARLLLGFGLTVLLILPLAWWMSQRLTRPIVAFSEAAAKVGFEDNAPPVLAVGSREVRRAAEVLNAMQARLRKQMESRTALMGAIAHDLKTPLARMRLRIEDLPAPLRDKLSSDIAHMDGLIRSAMSFTAAHKLGESLRPLDISALAEALADDMAAVCPMDAPLIEHNVMVRGDTVALRRIVTNLIENACRYAGRCRVELSTRGAEVELAVIDEGPGLPPDMLETVFEPFYRMEESRNRDTGGTGLGLSVAKALAEAQGGTLKLINRYEGATVVGLEARLTMPRLTFKS